MACVPMATFTSCRSNFSVPSASLSLMTGSSSRVSHSSLKMATEATSSSRSGLLHCSLLAPSSSLSFSSKSAFSGVSLGWDISSNCAAKTGKRQGLVVQAKKYSLCQTKRNRSRKSLARTHGFRKRMSTTSGRAVIKRRRAKGRWNLCPKTNPSSGKRA
ncbi:OLC1v1021352C1 [Oldenlandia corymbosa var. corymbosa]|uniref:Large ribosomal subunit protein bL34c n=1 Tax=Oldenlandia corymbosa var. corymbosa TaxID=529605 RepID=A0AAV1BXX0_OLDCO|nr:OLC1v1021352C1 [Oldenlandia corymbosa var. corymbosa]